MTNKPRGDIYTRGGDKGKTSLYDGRRVEKDDVRVEAYGTVDELNSFMGFAKSFVETEEMREDIEEVQHKLFVVAANLATENPDNIDKKIKQEYIDWLEERVDHYMDIGGDFEGFIVPGSSKASGALHIARSISRRAERRIITFSKTDYVDPLLMKYVNRLSDFLYSIAKANEEKVIDVKYN